LLLTLVEADVATTTQLGVLLQPCCFDAIGTSAQEKDYRDCAKVSPSLQVIPLRCDLKDRTAVVGRAKEMTLRIGQEPVSGSEDYPIAGATPRGHAVESAHGVDDHAALRSCPVRATSSLIASPKDQVVSSGSHPSPAAPVSDPVRVCCVRAKPCPRRLNDQGLLDSYGVYRSPWISCSFSRHLVIEGYPRTVGGEETRGQFLSSPKAPASSRPGQCDVPGFFYLESRICIKPGEQPATCMAFGLCLHACHLKRSQV